MTPSSETVDYTANKLAGLRSRGRTVAQGTFMATAVTPSHRGLFRRKADRAGMSTRAYAAKEAHAPGALGKEARLAQTFAKFRPKGTTLRTHLAGLRQRGLFGKTKAAA